jgi:dephospho-CoA kinase
MSSAFAFCGSIGSGKSSVSRAFAKAIKTGWNSFGDTLRRAAGAKGIEPSRENLQKLGARLVAEDAVSFCKQVVREANAGPDDHVVIDGIRHKKMIEILGAVVAPRTLVCIFVDCPLEARLSRLQQRDGLSEEQLMKFQSHSTEVEVEGQLRGAANMILNNSGSIQDALRELQDWAGTDGRAL